MIISKCGQKAGSSYFIFIVIYEGLPYCGYKTKGYSEGMECWKITDKKGNNYQKIVCVPVRPKSTKDLK